MNPIEVTGYETSRDYELLFELAKRQSVICIVDYNKDCRDVAHTLFIGKMGQISARGISYLHVFTDESDAKEKFVQYCGEINLEFLPPKV